MPLHRLPMKVAFDTGMLLPAFVISSECEKSFSFAARQKNVRIAASGKPRTPYDLGLRHFIEASGRRERRIPIPHFATIFPCVKSPHHIY